MYKPTDPRCQAAFLCMDIDEEQMLLAGNGVKMAHWKGQAALLRVIRYLVEVEVN